MKSKYVLGIDTSNYKTSVAVIDDNQSIICDIRRFLEVKQGEKGLRQSDALFQHVKNLPEMIEEVRAEFEGALDAVAYSSKPRPLEGSYMPVFLAGESVARAIGASLDIPVYGYSHQEGHIEAIKAYSSLKEEKQFLACHFSGGTTEVLNVSALEDGYKIDIVGGSKDISFGQVLDRAGVALNLNFPAGELLDNIAVEANEETKVLTAIKVKDGWLNLSGMDTQLGRAIAISTDYEPLIREVFHKVADAMVKMAVQCAEKTGIYKLIMAGGVSSSQYIRTHISGTLAEYGISVSFNNGGLAQDNAVGTALLGGKAIWR